MTANSLNVKHKKYFIFFLWLCFAVKIYAQVPQLHIYQFGVGQGDCSLIISRDYDKYGQFGPTSLLIDAGPTKNSGKIDVLWEFIKDTLTKYADGHLNYFIISHMHADHMNGAVALLEKMYDDTACRNVQIIDRFSFLDKYNINADPGWDYYNMEKQGTTILNYHRIINTCFPNNRITIRPEQALFILTNTQMTCVAANGAIKGHSFLKLRNKRTPLSENDLSFVFLLQFNGFSYFTGGDIGGGNPYSDGESPIAYTLNNTFGDDFHLCAFKVSHHGSSHSSNDYFLDVCKPTLGVIPSALRSFGGTRLPTARTLQALRNAGTMITYTFNPSVRGEYSSGTAVSYNDINIHLWEPPGLNAPVHMQLQAYVRDKNTWQIQLGTDTTMIVTCYKNHSYGPTAGKIMPPWKWWEPPLKEADKTIIK